MNESQKGSIVLTYKTEEPIPLEVFSRSLIALQNEYASVTNHASQLLVKEVRKGSFEIEFLVGLGLASLPLMNNVNSIAQFFQYMQSTTDWLLGKSTKPSEVKYSMKEITEFRDLFAPIANSSRVDTQVQISSPCQTTLLVSRTEAREIAENVRKMAADRESPSPYFVGPRSLTKVLFYWNQTRFDDNTTNAGNKGIIEAVDSVPRKVIFSDDSSLTKQETTTSNLELGKDWQ